ncbi:MAG: 4-hydroxybenzoate octaprenyltransferase [Planctomycetaceae bacterium]|jgi:4-hydroxybenzoate polyprenyltransferase|nr:4-hydroxybenzoate octaprenyltransferase [Planctomycetaceae bacterium]MDP7276427.1 UbiA-like polyprenyltransferase [Planctomycetaceae bacterium]
MPSSQHRQQTTDQTAGFLERVRQLLELIRFSHTVFALPFALLAAVLAWRDPTNGFAWHQLAGIVLAMVTARSAAMAFNRLVDRHHDAENPRTARRQLPTGELGVTLTWCFTLVCSAGFIASTLLFLLGEPPNPWPIRLSVPVLLFLLGYSFAKRFTSWCHYWLAAALMLSPLCVWIAIRGPAIRSVTDLTVPGVLAAAIFFWVGGFDIIYACQDIDHDRRAGLFSVPARFGLAGALRLAMFSHLLTIVSLLGLWWVAGLGPIFLVGVVAVSGLLVWEHWLVQPDDLSRVGTAFFNVNALISIGLLLIGLADVLICG